MHIEDIDVLRSRYSGIEIRNPHNLIEKHPHDELVYRDLLDYTDSIYTFIGAKIPCYGKTRKEQITDIDLIGIDEETNRIDVYEYKCMFRDDLLVNALEGVNKLRKYLTQENGNNAHIPDIEDRLSSLNAKNSEITYSVKFGDFEIGENIENIEIVSEIHVDDDFFEDVFRKLRDRDEEKLVNYLRSKDIFIDHTQN